ncbi:MAG: threonine ammonia-lyase [Candidatus Thorarchaeota archaeon]|nr:threonine ammonia-lyase [Candidatus Thorarchaeota archaeon]
MVDYEKMYEKIEDARRVLKGIARITPLDRSTTFSKMTGGEIYLKLENLQKTGSFKVRGAAYAMSQLDDDEKKAGVIAASAGNHAQGVAYAATRLGIKSTIVMPIFSPIAKIHATKGYGANVVLHGVAFDDALARAKELAEETGATFLHPFNNEDVIAGQGTIGLEIMDALPDVEVIAVPVGGGGLSTGIAIAAKHINPEVEVYGVEAASADAMRSSLAAGHLVKAERLDTVCDGIAVKQPGKLTYAIAKDKLTGVVTVEELEVTRTLFLLLERAKSVVEPAGTVGLCAYQYGKIDAKGKKAVAVLSGGNIDMSFLTRVINKELFRLGRSVRIRGTILDRVGVLNQIIEVVSGSGVSVIEIVHDRADPDIAPNKAELIMVLEIPEPATLKKLLAALQEKGFHFEVYED